MNEAVVVGIDVGKYEVTVCVQTGGRKDEARFQQTPDGQKALIQWLQKWATYPERRVCLEATGRYSQNLAQHLVTADWAVSVVNPYQIKRFAQSRLTRSKTDKVDAQVIAAFAQSQPQLDWSVPAPEWLQLQTMTRQLTELKRKRQRARNQLQAIPPALMVQSQLQAEIQFYEQQIQELKRALRYHVRQFTWLQAQVDLVQTIPGIGEQTAWILIGEVRCWSDFANVRAVVAYAGLDPTWHQSGTVEYSRGISKVGNRHLRAALYWPAMSARRHNSQIKAHSQRMAERGKTPQQQIVAAMRKLLHQVYGVLKSGQAYDPTYGMVQQLVA